MKLKLNFLILLFTLAVNSILFVSCSNDAPVTSSPSGSSSYYNWEHQVVNYDVIYSVVTQNQNTYYARGTNHFYKVTNNIPVPFKEMDSVFYTNDVTVFDNNYIVYYGYNVSKIFGRGFMVYDNGSYSNYIQTPSDSIYLSQVFIAERGKFYCYSYGASTYYKFYNGVFTEYSFPSGHIDFFGKAEGNTYAFVNTGDNSRSVYKVTDSGPVLLRSEPRPWQDFALKSDIIMNNSNYFYYFTEQGWVPFLPLQNVYDRKYPLYMQGENRNMFAVIGARQNEPHTSVYAWDGTNFTNQTNLPESLSALGPAAWTSGGYASNTFYFIVFTENGDRNLVKGVLR